MSSGLRLAASPKPSPGIARRTIRLRTWRQSSRNDALRRQDNGAGMPNPKVTVGLLLDRLRASLQLEEIEPGSGLDRIVGNPEVSSPGLVLAGYVKRFSAERLQVLGETEITYLQSLSPADRRKIFERFFSFPFPPFSLTRVR